MTKDQVTANDGRLLTLRRWPLGNRPRAVIQLAHGAAEHLGRYDRLASRLAAEGLAVIGADHRGHGVNACLHGVGALGPRGFQGVVDDMVAVNAYARETWGALPVVLLGHSFGSFAAQVFLVQNPELLDGLVLSGTAAVELLLDRADTSVGADALNAAFEPARTPFDWLSRDEAEVDAYIADPLCGHDITVESIATMPAVFQGIRSHPGLRRAGQRQIPIYVISGEMDPIVGPDQSLARYVVESYGRAGLNDVTHKIYPGGRHEMFNEVNRDRVMTDLVGWLDARFPEDRFPPR
jgi:alpha-beta hydrolase superfamily lysophospholipase